MKMRNFRRETRLFRTLIVEKEFLWQNEINFENVKLVCFIEYDFQLWYLRNRLRLLMALVAFGISNRNPPLRSITLSLRRSRAASLLDTFCVRVIFCNWAILVIKAWYWYRLASIKYDSSSPVNWGDEPLGTPALCPKIEHAAKLRKVKTTLKSFIVRLDLKKILWCSSKSIIPKI